MSHPETETSASSPFDQSLTENLKEHVKEGEIDSVNTPARYLAYASRFRTAILASSRYLAYTSEVGEAVRPIAHPNLVRAAYAVSWTYVLGDVGYEGYKAHHRGAVSEEWSGGSNAEVGVTVVKRGVFQSIASMLLPALTVHTTVKYTSKAFKDVKNVKIRTWGPTMLGLAVIPVLPYLFDEPMEHVIDSLFEPIEKKVKAMEQIVTDEKKTQ
ncbi:hypothetical protein DM01DRAFT_1278165 [Hesseltinella vesiculosa]|uniref:Mitochondrial fission process protein 1 n=1 Tax=Hesseltinella vesiculosa TaxID=101127 RepID=A0A1X2GYG5_9FUNG|nr:hypothetical protein DM01DRAFT_1278165 [Hesseltinella vesiculosa]